MKKRLNKKRLFYFIMICIIILLVLTGTIKGLVDFVFNKDEVQVKSNLDSIELYGYSLDDKDTELYKKYFNELKDLLNQEKIDDEEYAKLVTKLFVTDFYTLSNKLTSTDIGGLEFIHNDQIENFKIHAGDTMYNTIESDLNHNRTQKLPEVIEAEISESKEITYTYNGKEYVAYEIECNWEYKEDLGYDKEATFIVMKDNNKMNVVEEQIES